MLLSQFHKYALILYNVGASIQFYYTIYNKGNPYDRFGGISTEYHFATIIHGQTNVYQLHIN